MPNNLKCHFVTEKERQYYVFPPRTLSRLVRGYHIYKVRILSELHIGSAASLLCIRAAMNTTGTRRRSTEMMNPRLCGTGVARKKTTGLQENDISVCGAYPRMSYGSCGRAKERAVTRVCITRSCRPFLALVSLLVQRLHKLY